MSWLALLAVAAAWSLQFFDARPLLALPALAWCAAALLAWHGLGGRAALLVLAAGWTLCRAAWLFETRLPEALAAQDLLVQGVVCDFPRRDAEALRVVFERQGDGHDGLPARLQLSWYAPAPEIRPGERWQLRVRVKPPRGLANPAGFDFEHWLYQRAIGATGHVRPSPLNRRLERGWSDCPAGAVRGALAARVRAALDGRPGSAYVLGMTVGATEGLADADWDLLRRTGTTHLLAISGFNIAMVAAPFVFLVPWIGRFWPPLSGRPGAGLAVATAVAAVYSALAGFGVAVLRAWLMLAAVAALAWRRRAAGGFEALAAAALAIIGLDPPAVVSAGFWLSFAGVAWLLVAAATARAPTVGPEAGLVRRGAAAAATLLRVQLLLGIGLAPLTLAYFQQLSLVAPLANLLAVPVFSAIVMPLALGGAALVVPFPALGGPLLRFAAAVVAHLMDLLGRMAAGGMGVWQPPPARPLALGLCALATVLLAWWRPLPLRSLALVLLLPLAAGGAAGGAAGVGQLRVTVMDVGQGLAVLVQTARHALVYDAGPAYRLRDAGESVVVPVLRAAGVRHLDALVISHADNDHAGGARAVLEAHPEALLLGPALRRLAPASHRPCLAGEAWDWDGVRFRVLSPAAGAQLSDNDGSCVLRVDAPGGSVLLPGDIQRRQEDALAASGLLGTVDLVLAPHHGSRTSSGQALVAATRPRFVVFSAGYLNRWGFPAAAVRERWRAAGACGLATAAEGAMVFTAAEGGLRLVHRQRHDGAHLWTSAAAGTVACAEAAAP